MGRRFKLGFTPLHQPRRWTLNQVRRRRRACLEARPFTDTGRKYVFQAHARSEPPPCVVRGRDAGAVGDGPLVEAGRG